MSVETKDRIETPELLQLAGISKQTFHNWLMMELIPGWSGRVLYGGRGSRYWYPPETLDLAKKIKSWREQGIPYRQIRELLKGEKVEL